MPEPRWRRESGAGVEPEPGGTAGSHDGQWQRMRRHHLTASLAVCRGRRPTPQAQAPESISMILSVIIEHAALGEPAFRRDSVACSDDDRPQHREDQKPFEGQASARPAAPTRTMAEQHDLQRRESIWRDAEVHPCRWLVTPARAGEFEAAGAGRHRRQVRSSACSRPPPTPSRLMQGRQGSGS